VLSRTGLSGLVLTATMSIDRAAAVRRYLAHNGAGRANMEANPGVGLFQAPGDERSGVGRFLRPPMRLPAVAGGSRPGAAMDGQGFRPRGARSRVDNELMLGCHVGRAHRLRHRIVDLMRRYLPGRPDGEYGHDQRMPAACYGR